MVKISRILMPVDFSDRCLGMTHYARAIAEKYDAEIILLHVVNPVFVTPDIGMAPPAVVAMPQWLIDEKSKLLDGFAVAELAGQRVRRLVYEGLPEMQIVEAANSEDVQLLIMPTHGYGVFRRFVIGSVTAKVLHDVNYPVLTGVHMEKHVSDTKVEFRTVVCAVDLNTRSTETLLAAARLASDFGGKLAVVHVAQSPEQGSTATAADLQPQLEELVAGELAKNNLTFGSGRLAISVKLGDIDKTICDFTANISGDILVIGRAHGDDEGDRAGGHLRSHTYSIIRQASCPVLSL
jgi:nucleotide-binding universal stress UspA family protein